MVKQLRLVDVSHIPASWQSHHMQRMLLTRRRPGLSHSLIGLLTTVINVGTLQGGHFSSTATVTVVVTAVLSGCTLVLCVVYGHVLARLDREDETATG
jgi:hypothetical protein